MLSSLGLVGARFHTLAVSDSVSIFSVCLHSFPVLVNGSAGLVFPGVCHTLLIPAFTLARRLKQSACRLISVGFLEVFVLACTSLASVTSMIGWACVVSPSSTASVWRYSAKRSKLRRRERRVRRAAHPRVGTRTG